MLTDGGNRSPVGPDGNGKKGTMAMEGGVNIHGEWLGCAHAWVWMCLRGCVLPAEEKAMENCCVVENREGIGIAWPLVWVCASPREGRLTKGQRWRWDLGTMVLYMMGGAQQGER